MFSEYCLRISVFLGLWIVYSLLSLPSYHKLMHSLHPLWIISCTVNFWSACITDATDKHCPASTPYAHDIGSWTSKGGVVSGMNKQSQIWLLATALFNVSLHHAKTSPDNLTIEVIYAVLQRWSISLPLLWISIHKNLGIKFVHLFPSWNKNGLWDAAP